MIPVSTTLRNIGTHTNTVIPWAELQSPVAIVGQSGSGKTTLADASLFAAIYGAFAFYTGSIYNRLTHNGTGKGSIEHTFRHRDQLYTVTRELARTASGNTSQEAWLQVEGQDEPVAGPKASDTDTALLRIIGPEDLALATWYLSQSRRGDLVGLPTDKQLAARRRAVFDILLGTQRLETYAELAAKAEREANAAAKELSIVIQNQPDYQELIRQAESTIARNRDAIRQGTEALATAKARHRDAEQHRMELEAQRANLDRESADFAAIEAAERHAQTNLQNLKRQLDEATGARDTIPSLEEKAAKLQELRAERERLREEWRRYDLRRRHIAGEDALRREVERINNEARLYEAKCGVDDATRTLAAGAAATRAEIARQQQRDRDAKERNNAARRKRVELEARISTLQRDIASTSEAIARKPETPFGDGCAPCRFLADYARLPEKLRSLEGEFAAQQQQLAALPAMEMEDTLDQDLVITMGRQEAAAKRIAEAEESLRQVELANQARDAKQAELDQRMKERPDGPDEDPSPAGQDLSTRIEALSAVDQDLTRARTLAEQLPILTEQHQAAATAHSAAVTAAERARSQQQSLQNRRRELDTSIAEATLSTNAAADACRKDEETILAAEREAAGEQARLDEHRNNLARLKESIAREGELRRNASALSDLRTACGPKGVRQLLISNAAPALSTIADELFDIATGGTMRLRIETQRAAKDGTLIEDLQILVTDANGERDVSEYSGGEQQLCRVLLRIATMLFVRSFSHAPQLLFLDEAFDALDREKTEGLLRVIEHVRDQIPYIVAITHNPAIAERFASQIRVLKTAHGSTIQIHTPHTAAA